MRHWRSRHKRKVKAANRKWRINHYAEYQDRKKKDVRARQQWLAAIKQTPCMDCGVQYPSYVMQFDHRDPALKRAQVNAYRSIQWMKDEIKKCDLVCANCHAERTHQQRLAGLFRGGRPKEIGNDK